MIEQARAPDGRWFVLRAEGGFTVLWFLYFHWDRWQVVVRRAADDPIGRPVWKARCRNRLAALRRLDALVAGIRAGTWDPERG